MSFYSNIRLIIENKETLNFYYSLNNNTTFEDLLEFVMYYYPDKNICPCFKFQYSKDGKNTNYIDIENIEKIEEYINKKIIQFFVINNYSDKNCHCEQIILNDYKKSKTQLFKNIKVLRDIEKKENLIEKIRCLEKENEKLKEENKQLEKNMELLKFSINGDVEKIQFLKNNGIIGLKEKENAIKIDLETNKIMGNNKFKETNFIEFYDVIVDIKSIKDICKGWDIKLSKRAKKNYESFKKDKIIKIGVIGNSNKGKSFILSKLSKIDLPSGTSIRTEGLSIKYPELDLFKDRKIALLDSAGLETPVLKEEEKVKEETKVKQKTNEKDNEKEMEKESEDLSEKELFKEKSREKLITELFLQSYIINNSDILLIVVGIMTYSEQKLLNRIKTEIKKSKIKKPLFIIHNLFTYTSVPQVQDYINKYILKSATFNLEEGHKISSKTQTKTGIYYYEKNSEPKIFHLIYANDGSEAGKYYNDYTLDFLEGEYQTVTDLKPFDAIDTIKDRFIKISKDIIEQTKKQLDKNDFETSNNETIKLNNPNNITLKKCFIDELGFSNLKANGFEPTYNYYKKDDKIIVRIEAPGNCSIKTNIDFAGEYTFIRITGNKKKDKEPARFEDNLYNSREMGFFSIDIPLKTEEFLIKNENPKCIEKKGVLVLEFGLDKRKIDEGFNISEEDEI